MQTDLRAMLDQIPPLALLAAAAIVVFLVAFGLLRSRRKPPSIPHVAGETPFPKSSPPSETVSALREAVEALADDPLWQELDRRTRFSSAVNSLERAIVGAVDDDILTSAILRGGRLTPLFRTLAWLEAVPFQTGSDTSLAWRQLTHSLAALAERLRHNLMAQGYTLAEISLFAPPPENAPGEISFEATDLNRWSDIEPVRHAAAGKSGTGAMIVDVLQWGFTGADGTSARSILVLHNRSEWT